MNGGGGGATSCPSGLTVEWQVEQDRREFHAEITGAAGVTAVRDNGR